MENPYSPLGQSGHEVPKGSSSRMVVVEVIAGAMIGLFIAMNYKTATEFSLSTTYSSMHVVLLLAPFALAAHWRHLTSAREIKGVPFSKWMLVPMVGIPLSFAVSLTPYFSINPYEAFFVHNYFFGPYGWMPWMWLIVLGVFPYATLSGWVRRSRWALVILAVMALLGHIHNAYIVWTICHL